MRDELQGEKTPELPITYRPPIWAKAVTCLMFTFVSCAILVGFVFLKAPVGALVIVGLLVFGALVSQFWILRASIRFDRDGITHRFAVKRFYAWPDIEAWTQWDGDAGTYLRTKSAKTFQLSNWCVYGVRRNREVYAVLQKHLGPETQGPNAVIYPFLRSMLEGLAGKLR